MRLLKPSFFLFIFLHILSFSLFAQSANLKIEKVENNLLPLVRIEGQSPWTLEERMKHYNTPGLSIAVIDNYEIVWAKAYGYADAKEKIPLTVETPFQSASISKTMNAIGILKLVESGQLDLSKDINEYLQSWKFPYSEEGKGKIITLLHLLSHTGGLSTSGFRGYEKAKKLPTLVQILDGKKPANSDPVRSLFEPGLQFQYSGGGTVITQLIIEDLLQQSYEEYIHQSILKPLGMSNSFYTIPKKLKTDVASGHQSNGNRLSRKYHYYPEQAPAGLWSTPFDLSRMIIELQKSLDGQSDRLLSKESTALMTTPVLEDHITALGTFVKDQEGVKYFEHSGSNEGFKCKYYASLKGGKGVVVMTNGENYALVPEVIRSVASVYKWKNVLDPTIRTIAKIESDQLTPYNGTYHFDFKNILRIESEGDQLFLYMSNGRKVNLYPESSTFFFMQVVNEQVEFTKEDGEWVLNLHREGKVQKAKKIK